MMQVPIKVSFSKKCKRGGLRYPRKKQACVHCENLSDSEVMGLKERIKEEHVSNHNLGQLFFYISSVIMLFMLVIAVSS